MDLHVTLEIKSSPCVAFQKPRDANTVPVQRQPEGTLQEAGDKLKLWTSLMQTNSNHQVDGSLSSAPEGREKLTVTAHILIVRHLLCTVTATP